MASLAEKKSDTRPKSLKMVIMGLDNAGKTSILLSIARKYDPLKLRPTLGADRSLIDVLGFKITRLDLGGQEKYRKTYLDENSEVLFGTDLLIYVVDVQDSERFSESVAYFDDIAKYYEEKKENNPLLVVFFHKSDPHFLQEPAGQGAVSKLIHLFKERVTTPLTSFFLTSIFNRDTLMYAFSQSLFRLFPHPNLINNFLANFIEKHNLEGIFVYDHNFLHIGSAYVDDPAKSHAILQSLHRIYVLFEALVKVSEEGYKLAIELQKQESLFELKFVFRQIILHDTPIYLVLVGAELQDIDSLLLELQLKFEAIKSELSLA
jgi:small GTP-binding protein